MFPTPNLPLVTRTCLAIQTEIYPFIVFMMIQAHNKLQRGPG